VRSSSPICAALKLVRITSSSIASLVSSRQPKPIFSIYANDLDSQSDGGTQDGRFDVIESRGIRRGEYSLQIVRFPIFTKASSKPILLFPRKGTLNQASTLRRFVGICLSERDSLNIKQLRGREAFMAGRSIVSK